MKSAIKNSLTKHLSLIFIFALATNLTTSHPANAQNKSQDKSQDTESAFIQRRIDENPVKPSADYSLSGYSAEDQVIRFSSPKGSDKIISIPFNLPSGVKTSVIAGRFLVIEDEGGSTFSGGALEHAKKIYLDMGSFFDRKNPNPTAKHSYLSEDGKFQVTSRKISRAGLYDESLDFTTSFFWNDLSKKKAIRDGYKMYKSKSGFTSVFYNPNGLPPLILVITGHRSNRSNKFHKHHITCATTRDFGQLILSPTKILTPLKKSA